MEAEKSESAGEGLRERKRRETANRITEVGLRLFIRKGFDETTLDEIATEAGISRRTFFYYFKSKDDIMLSMQSGTGDMIAAALRAQPRDKAPFDAVRDAVMQVIAAYPADEMIVIDRLMRASASIQAAKQASYVAHENTLFAALRDRWPMPERAAALRMVAMISIGVVRLSLEAFGREDGKRPLVEHLEAMFATVENEVLA